MIITISRSIEIDAGHRVPFHISKCKHLHGHRWKITAFMEAEGVVPDASGRPDSGMVLDFGVLKSIMMEHIHDVFDHRFMLWAEDKLVTSHMRSLLFDGEDVGVILVPIIPTAENLAQHWARLIEPHILKSLAVPARLVSLEVKETPNSTATYWPAR